MNVSIISCLIDIGIWYFFSFLLCLDIHKILADVSEISESLFNENGKTVKTKSNYI